MFKAKISTRIALIAGSSLILLMMGATLAPQITSFASAATASKDTAVNTYISPVISITAPNTMNMFVDSPAGGSDLVVSHDHIRVATNNITGYRLLLSMSENSANTRLEHTLRPDLYYIESVKSNTAAADFPINSWGYTSSINDPADPSRPDSFQALPQIGTNIQLRGGDGDVKAHGPVENDPTYVATGVRANMKIASGTYNNAVTFTAITNEIPGVSVTFDQAFSLAGAEKITAGDGNQYYRMQDMTTEVCANVTPASGTTTQTTTLVDDRDDKKTYTVSKLRDGNCWMTDSLRLGHDTDGNNITLTSDDSNVENDFVLPGMPLNKSWSSNAYTTPLIYASDDRDKTSDGFHGYYGYYYNWNAATAGTGVQTGQNAPSDICPKGWSLPTNYTVNPNRSYSKLLFSHGVIAKITDNSAYAGSGWEKMRTEPLRFVLSGSHGTSGTAVGSRGEYGSYWSSSSSSPADAYYLYFSSRNVYPQYPYGRKTSGFTVRCLAR